MISGRGEGASCIRELELKCGGGIHRRGIVKLTREHLDRHQAWQVSSTSARNAIRVRSFDSIKIDVTVV